MSNDLISRSELMEFAEYDVNFRLVIPYEKVKKAQTVYDVEAVCEEIKVIGTRFCPSVSCNMECSDCDHGVLMKTILQSVRNGGMKE